MRYSVFAYGTLMFPGIAVAVTGKSPQREPARLDGHARHALRDRPYPAAVPRGGHSIEGVLLRDLSAATLARVDEFEGELYRRRRVRVCGADGSKHEALVYLLRPRWHPLLLPHDWDLETFRRQWHAHYVQQVSAEFDEGRRRHTAAGR